MKRWRLLIAIVALLILLVVVAHRSLQGLGRGSFATPEECVEASAEACKEGDVSGYLGCLAGPLLELARRQAEAGELPAGLRRSMAGVKSWVTASGAVEGDRATVDVDVVRPEGTRRIRYHLRQTSGWRIVAVDAPRDVPTPVRYGTHVSEVPGE